MELLKTPNSQNLVGGALGKEVTVSQLTHEVAVECRDLNAIMMKSNTREELVQHFQTPVGSADAIKNLPKIYDATQAAIINSSNLWVNKFLEAGKVKIGWLICKVREKISLAICLRYLEYVQIARPCTSKRDKFG